jgi:hypothetical protein
VDDRAGQIWVVYEADFEQAGQGWEHQRRIESEFVE